MMLTIYFISRTSYTSRSQQRCSAVGLWGITTPLQAVWFILKALLNFFRNPDLFLPLKYGLTLHKIQGLADYFNL